LVWSPMLVPTFKPYLRPSMAGKPDKDLFSDPLFDREALIVRRC